MWIVIELQLFSNPKVVLLTGDLDLVLYKYNKGYGWNVVEYDRFQKDKVTTIKNDQAGRIVLVYYKEEDKI